jgi:chemotaxis signal transduction protein
MTANPKQSSNPATKAVAWLLSFGDGLYAAIGDREMQYVIHSPLTTRIPASPFYCDQVMIWNNHLLPVFDLASWLTDGQQVCQSRLISVVAYRHKHQHTPHYAGLRLHKAPKRVKVYDEQACTLPEENTAWRKLAASSFKYLDDKHIPILDLQTVFSQSSTLNS